MSSRPDRLIAQLDGGSLLERYGSGSSSLVYRGAIGQEKLILYRLDTFKYYSEHRILAHYVDGGDPPDYMYFIPIDEIIENPILSYGDQRLAYKGRYFVDAETEWTNEIYYTRNCAVIITRSALSVHRLPGGEASYYRFPTETGEVSSFHVDRVDGDTIHIKYLRDDLPDFDYDGFDDELSDSDEGQKTKWDRPCVSVMVLDLSVPPGNDPPPMS